MIFTMKRHAAALFALVVAASLHSAGAAGTHSMHSAHAAEHTDKTSAEASALSGNSIYHLPVNFVDQNGSSFDLASRRGKPMIVSMFYTSCQFVCPMLIETIQLTGQKLTADERAQLKTLLVTFDTAHDDVAALKGMADKRQLDSAHWTLARTDAASLRKFAATLGIQYRQLPDGEFNHSTVLILLDGQGRIVGKTNKMGTADPAFVTLVKKTLHGSE
jgi:protein SCO1